MHSNMRGKKGLEYFESLHSQEGRKFAPLETARLLLEHLGNPQDKIKSIHVAGTNGKGTVCSLLSAMLHSAGFSVGQSCSPHLMNVTERCLINGRPDSEEAFGEAIEKIVEICEHEKLLPSYFVLGVVASFYEFARLGLDWMVIEVGLGGELDATNLIKKPEATVISNIGLDHTEILGKTTVEISRSKAGIAKKDVPMFVSRVELAVEKEIEKICLAKGARPYFYEKDFYFKNGSLKCFDKEIALKLENLKLEGAHQKENAILAAVVLSHLGISAENINSGLGIARWPGRLEFFSDVSEKTDILLDVAHNPGGIEVLGNYLKEKVPGNWSRLVFVISILKRKEWEKMLAQLLELETYFQSKKVQIDFVFTSSSHIDALAPEVMRNFVAKGQVLAVDNILNRISFLSDPKEKNLIVITGSLFLVGEVRGLLRKDFCTLEQ